MKRFVILLLALCMLFSVSCMTAEETEPFVPGAITMRLLRQSLEHGRHVSADISGIFVPGEHLADNPDEAEMLKALSDLLSNSALRLGYARTDEGLRLEIGGYCLGEESIVFSDNALTFNKTGIIVDSDMMDGRRVTLLWETVLRYLDVDEDTTSAILSLREEDLSALLSDLVNKHLPVLMQMAGDTAAPYAASALEWFASLPAESVGQISGHEDLAVPESLTLTQVTIGRKDLLRLADSLLSQLEKDDVLLPLLDTALSSDTLQLESNGSALGSAGEFLSALRSDLAEESAKADDSTAVITVTYGFAGSLTPFILSIDAKNTSGEKTVCFLLEGLPGEDAHHADVTLLLSAAEGDNVLSFTAHSSLFSHMEDPLNATADISCSLELNSETLFSMESSEKLSPFTAQSGQPGYRDEQNTVASFAVPSEDENGATQSTRSVTESTTEWVRSEDGGEGYTVHGISDLYIGEDSVSTIADASFTIEPAEGGLFDATAYETISLPSQNIDSIGFIALISADDYIPLTDAFQTVAWEDLTRAERDELQNDILNSARIKRNQLLEAIPVALRGIATEYIGGIYEESDMPSQEGYMDGFAEGYSTGYDDGFRAGYEAATGRPFPAEIPESDTAEGSPDA